MGNSGGFLDELKDRAASAVIVIMAILGVLLGAVLGAAVVIAWDTIGGRVFFPDAATIGDLPVAYRAVGLLAQLPLWVVGGMKGAKTGRELMDRRRVEDSPQ